MSCCSICTESSIDSFDLSCGDTVCTSCAKVMFTHLSHRAVLDVLCPLCATPVTEDLSRLQIHSDAPADQCQNCEKQNGVIKCENCDILFCEDCDGTIHSSRAMQKHTRHRVIVDRGEDSVDAPVVGYKPLSCEEHVDCVVDTHCNDCHVSVCEWCIANSHSSHTLTPIVKMVSSLRLQLQEGVDKATCELDTLQTYIQKYPEELSLYGSPEDDISSPTHVGRAVKCVHEEFDMLEIHLSERKDILLCEAEQVANSCVASLKKHKDSLQKVLANCMHTLTKGKAALSEPNRADVDGVKTARDEIEKSLTGHDVGDLHSLDTVGGDLEFTWSTYLSQAILTHGVVPHLSTSVHLSHTGDERAALLTVMGRANSAVNQTNALDRRLSVLMRSIGGTQSSESSTVSALQQVREDVTDHFQFNRALLLRRRDDMVDEVRLAASVAIQQMTERAKWAKSTYMSLYSNIINVLRVLLKNDNVLYDLHVTGSCPNISEMRTVPPLPPAACSTQGMGVSFPVDIVGVISDHGSVWGPPPPADLRVKFDHHGEGSKAVLSWVHPTATRSGSFQSSLVSQYVVQQSILICEQESLSTEIPFTHVTECSGEVNTCSVDLAAYPRRLVLLRVKSVGKDGGGCWSDVVKITTPNEFNRVFEFSEPFDTNGILYYLGCKGLSATYENPHLINEVHVSTSTSMGSAHIFVNHSVDSSFCMTHNRPHSWLTVDIGEGRFLRPSHYCLRSAKGEAWKLRNWDLQAKVAKDDKWTVIRRHRNDTSLTETSHSHAFWTIGIKSSQQSIETSNKKNKNATSTTRRKPISPQKSIESCESDKTISEPSSEDLQVKAYRYFRIIQTGLNSTGDHFLVCNGIELYGVMYSSPMDV